MTPDEARLAAHQERVIFDRAHGRYRTALVDPAIDVSDLLWLQDTALACFVDYLHAVERELLVCLEPAWLRLLVRAVGIHRISRAAGRMQQVRRWAR